MSVVMCVRTVRAMARWCAIATVVTVLLAGCKSQRAVLQQSDTQKIVREIDTLVTVAGGDARLIADVEVVNGELSIGSVESAGNGVNLSARVERTEAGDYQLVVDATVPEREVAVRLREEKTDVSEYNSEERHHDSSGVPMWVVVAVVAIVLTVICIMRWMK